MKKLLVFALSIVVLLNLVACAGAGSSSQPAETSEGGTAPVSSGGATVTIMGNARMYEGEEQAWEEVAAAFEAETGIHIDIRWQGKWDEVPQNLSAAKLAGEKVDIVTVGAGLINSSVAPSGALMDITELMEPYRDRFTDGMLDAYTIGGRLWGFPYGNSAAGFIYYNKTMFDELDISEPATFEDLVAISEKITEEKGITPLIFRGKDESYWPNWYFSTYAQATGNTSIQNVQEFLSGRKQFTGDAEIEAFEMIQRFYDEGVLTSDSFDTNGDGMKAAFFQEKAAMMHTHNFQLMPDSVDFELGIFEFPLMVTDGSAYSQPSGGPGTGIAIPAFADRDNLDNTMQFIAYLLQPENANRIISCYKPVVEVVKGVEVAQADIITRLNEELIPKTIPYLDWIWPAEINAAFMQAIPEMLSGNITAAQAAQTVQNAFDTIVAERGYVFEWWEEWTDAQWAEVTP